MKNLKCKGVVQDMLQPLAKRKRSAVKLAVHV